MKDFIKSAPRFIFFTGKGGVGKTSMPCVVASARADQGKRVLLISTDRAAHLTHMLAESVPNLQVSRMDPKEETRKYVAAVLEEKQGLLSNEILGADHLASLFHPQTRIAYR